MVTSENSNININKFAQILAPTLRPFKAAYVFGSFIVSAQPNDIDILLVYQDYTPEVKAAIDIISIFVKNITGHYADFTVLSSKELFETDFLNWLSPKAKRIK